MLRHNKTFEIAFDWTKFRSLHTPGLVTVFGNRSMTCPKRFDRLLLVLAK
ncbi:hypothetical protein [uncultured Rubinisphaera sp.]